MTIDLREAFEAWRLRTTSSPKPCNSIARHGMGDDAPYEDRTTRGMWIAYQVAHNRLAEPVRRMRHEQSEATVYSRTAPNLTRCIRAESEVDALIKETKNG